MAADHIGTEVTVPAHEDPHRSGSRRAATSTAGGCGRRDGTGTGVRPPLGATSSGLRHRAAYRTATGAAGSVARTASATVCSGPLPASVGTVSTT